MVTEQFLAVISNFGVNLKKVDSRLIQGEFCQMEMMKRQTETGETIGKSLFKIIKREICAGEGEK